MENYIYLFGLLLTAVCSLSLELNKFPLKLELQNVNIIFRHGDRTPEKFRGEMYPTDPNINNTFYPMGYGGLTNNGKLRAYSLGQFLREKYDNFLGDIYLPEDIMARSTNFDRTKMSLLAVLAALYPPNKIQKWYQTLNWQPIPIDYENPKQDSLLMPTGCPRFKAMEREIRQLPEVLKKSLEFKELLRKLTHWSGNNMTHCKSIYNLYNTLVVEKTMNLKIPQWADDILANGELEKGVAFHIQLKNYNTTLRKFNGGRLLRKMTNNMISRIDGNLEKGKKMNLYSAHDINVIAHLLTLGVSEAHQPFFTSAVILELYRDFNNNYHVQVLYYKGDSKKAEIMTIPNCTSTIDNMCEFNQFCDLMNTTTPSSEELLCT
ncbi:venom acid phosphatase Acph-1-like [Leptopilina boulardi]|uniref:venom acid phosphatase Acph-1-like n=1 Tax=Leptopilina boulardi TaxID=63433 RepID=UPI0021F64F02|nr:venom acid phosphatase Acph-1-like [Leptopilina boulardi]XP_051154900.1 venom acid phosphatase Acph-1-like [Leptopilina boulardi]XP_051154901.1 venom acid phosphatase Acph-1-like [Leptopilina boulardi]